MNGKPHTHQVQVLTKDGHYDIPYYKIKYGDTTTHAWRRLPFRKFRLERAVKRAIRRHDRGSRRAHTVASNAWDLQNAYNSKLVDTEATSDSRWPKMKEEWGTELAKRKTHG